MDAWWDRKARIEYELQKLEEEGFRPQYLGEIPQRGPFSLIVQAEIAGGDHELTVTFPDLYPYFRFEVEAPTLFLPLHQNPLGKNLRLLGRSEVFRAQSDTVAHFLTERLPSLLKAAETTSVEEAFALEELQAEPVTEYFPYLRPGVVLIDGSWTLPDDANVGSVELGTDQTHAPFCRLAVLGLHDAGGNRLVELDARLARLFQRKLRGQWAKIPRHILEADPARFLSRLKNEHLRGHQPPNRVDGYEQEFYLVIAPEEASWRDSTGQGWLALTTIQQRLKGGKRRRKQRGPAAESLRTYFLRVARAGKEDLAVRVPELRPLRDKTVSVVGLGSLGAPTALALAQAGIGALRLVDDDWIDPGTSVRWARGLSAAGGVKTQLLEKIIERDYPYTRVDRAAEGQHRIGAASNAQDLEKLCDLVDGSDVLVDTTGEHNVQYFLSELVRELRIPFLTVSGTLGGWGGRIFRSYPEGSAGCWWCYETLERSGEIPVPAAGEEEPHAVQPRGCGDRTFTGAGFDMHTLALAAVRAVVEMLSPDYPRPDWDALVVSFRGLDGLPTVPRFQGIAVPRDPHCPCCVSDAQKSG